MMVVRKGARVVVAAAALVLGTITAHASDATQFAERAGFLIGHALRCGAGDARIQRSGAAMQKAIAAFATDEEDKQEAEARFGARVLASLLGEFLDDPVPSCKTVIAEFSRFEREGASALAQSGKQGTGKQSSRRSPASKTAARPKNQRDGSVKTYDMPSGTHATRLTGISAIGPAGVAHEGGKLRIALACEVQQ